MRVSSRCSRFAALAAGVLLAAGARADPRSDLERVLPRSSPPSRWSPSESAQRQLAPEVGGREQPSGSTGQKQVAAAREQQRAPGEGAGSQQASRKDIEDLRAELHELRVTVDRLARAARQEPLQARRPESSGAREPRAESSSPRTLIAEGKVAATSAHQVVLRADNGNLLLLRVGTDAHVHRGDERLEPGALIRGTPVRARYQAAQDGELRASEIEVEESG